MKRKKYLFCLLLIGTITVAYTQDKRISLRTEYNMPVGKMKSILGSAFGYQLNFSSVSKDVKGVFPGFGVTLGYTQFKPLADTLYFEFEDYNGVTQQGEAAYGNKTMFQLSGTFFWPLTLKNKKVEFSPGIEMGLFLTLFEYYIHDKSGENNSDNIATNGAIIPNLYIGYNINDHFQISPYFKFNMVFALGSADVYSSDYNSNLGLIDYYYSLGTNITYKF